MITEKSLLNLKPVSPGDPGRNPSGRPKGSKNLRTTIEKWLKVKGTAVHPLTKKSLKLTQLDIIILAQMKAAGEGSTPAFNALADRLVGKPEQQQNIAFEEGAAEITVRIGKAD